MIWKLFSFEARYWLRGMMVWVFLVIIGTLIFAASSSDKITVGGGLENTYRNAPFVVQNFYAIMGILTLLMTTVFVRFVLYFTCMKNRTISDILVKAIKSASKRLARAPR